MANSRSICRLEIKAVPNADRSEVVGLLGDALKVKIQVPPVDGRANEVLFSFLAQKLALPKRAVHLLQGNSVRKKLVGIDGLDRETALRLLLS